MAKHHTDKEVLDILTKAARPWGVTQLVSEPNELLRRTFGYSKMGAHIKLRRLQSAGAVILEDATGVVGRPKIVGARIVRENT